MSLITKDFNFEIKEISEKGEFSGYGSLFGIKDSYKDIVMPGAFAKSLKKSKPKMLWQHRSSAPIGVWTVAQEDKKGLYLEGKLVLEVAQAKEAHALMMAKAINGLSIGYRTIISKYNTESRVRELFELDLWEVSLVTFPALKPAKVQRVKSSNSDFGQSLNLLSAQLNMRRAALALQKLR